MAIDEPSLKRRAEQYLGWLAQSENAFTFRGRLVVSEEAADRLAEVIGEALEELREGFLRKPRGETKTHG